jgi:hypothetical protein
MNAIRDAARRLLDEGEGDAVAPTAEPVPVPVVDRITCDVQTGRQSELVTLRMLEGRIQTACTCGRVACAHMRVVLQLMAAPPAGEASRPTGRVDRVSVEPRVLSERSRSKRAAALCEPLADLITAVVRAGVESERNASVHESLSRVERALPAPLPLGLLRWLGCMHEALATRDVGLVAHALAGAALFAADLRAPALDESAALRVSTWLGSAAGDDLQRLSDRHMVELAREWVSGTARNQIERRYLLDLESGEIFREESARRGLASSLGPCPRTIGVSLAEVEPGCAPRRLRLLQYTTTPDIDGASWDTLAGWAQRDARALSAGFRSALQQLGVLAEPFALLVPLVLQPGPVPKLLFEHGPPLPLAAHEGDDESGVLQHLESLFGAQAPAWVGGRVLLRGGQVMLQPLAAGILDASGTRHQRL